MALVTLLMVFPQPKAKTNVSHCTDRLCTAWGRTAVLSSHHRPTPARRRRSAGFSPRLCALVRARDTGHRSYWEKEAPFSTLERLIEATP